MELTREEENVLYLLKKFKGQKNAIPYKTLAGMLRINERELRSIVASLVTDKNFPIGSNSQGGYFIMTDREEFEHSHRELLSRIKALSARARGLRRAYEKYIKKDEQMSLI
jgi:hypothetical protein